MKALASLLPLLPMTLLGARPLAAHPGNPPAASAPAPLPVGDLAGRWSGTDDKGITATFDLDTEGYATLVMKGERLGGHPAGGPSLRYRVDGSHSPAWIDFIMVDPQGQERARLKGLVERLAADQIRLRLDFSGERPKGFQDATPDTCITLRRQP